MYHIFKFALCIITSIMMARVLLPNVEKKGMLIFIDTTEVGLGAVTGHFVTALSQNAGPIIVSNSLVKNLFSNSDMTKYIKAAQFDASNWFIKKINSSYCLFLSKNIIDNSYDISLDTAVSLTPLELKLGLKVNHMKNLDLKDVYKFDDRDSFLDTLYNSGRQEGSIFCTNADYAKQVASKPAWSLYLVGHGRTDKSMVGMPIEDFKQMLNFFMYKIDTQLLVYTSCYAAGANIDRVYKDLERAIQKTYPFSIITQAITDAPIMGILPEISDKGKKLSTFLDFNAFIKASTDPNYINLEQIVNHIFPSLPDENLQQADRQAWGNIPQIKLPGVEWFSVLASQKEIVSIGAVLAQTRGVNKPLNMVSYFKTDPQAILLYAKNVPFELIIDSKNLKSCISMIPGDVIHTFSKVSFVGQSIENILNIFMSVKNLSTRKIFFIKELNTYTDVIIANTQKVGNIAYEIPDEYQSRAFFKDKNDIYVQNTNEKLRIAYTNEIEDYRELLMEASGSVGFLSDIRFSKGRLIGIGDSFACKMCIIDTISSDPIAYFNDIVIEIQNKIKQDGFLFIKNLECLYDTIDMNIPGYAEKSIKITDVIIEKASNKVYFTHDGKFYNRKTQLNDSYLPAYQSQLDKSGSPSSDTFASLRKLFQKKITRDDFFDFSQKLHTLERLKKK